MEKYNAKWATVKRRISLLSLALMMTSLFAPQASARILFQDDTFHDIESEGMIINFDDGGDEDVTLQFGNDLSDASIIFDDGTGNMTLATPGGEFNFSDDNLTGTGGLDFDGNINFSNASELHIRENADPATNSACTTLNEIILDTTDNEVQICTLVGVAGVATWENVASGSLQDFESVYSQDGDDTLTATGTFDIDAVGAVGIDSDAAVTVDGAGVALTSDGGALALTGDGAADIDISNAGAAIDVDSATMTIDTTGQTSINTSTWDISGAGVASGFTGLDSSGTVDFSSASAFRTREIAGITNPGTTCTTVGEIIMDTTAQVLYVCTNAATNTWSNVSDGGDADTLDGFDSTQFLRSDTSDNYTSGTLTFDAGTTLAVDGTLDVNGAATIGDGGDSISIDSSTWDISSAGAASGFTTYTGSGDITTTGGDLVIGTTGLNDTAAGASGAGLVGFDNTNSANLSSTTTQGAIDEIVSDFGSTANGDGASLIGIEDAAGDFTATTVEGALTELASSVSGNFDAMTFEAEYPNVVVYEDGTNNRGKLEALYDDTNREQYYRWTTRKTASHDIDLRFRYELPSDFDTSGDMTLDFRNDTVTPGDNSVAVTVRNDTDNTLCHADPAATAAGAGTWETLTITAAEMGVCTPVAGDVLEVQIKMAADNTNSGGTDVGTLKYDYTK